MSLSDAIQRRALLAGALAALPAPGFAQPRQNAAEQVFRGAVGVDDIRTLDPHFSIGFGEGPIIDAVYEGLLGFPDGQVSSEGLRPALAERWESSADGLTWTFHLRRGVQWHHGFGAFTADDVVFSLERARAAATGSPFRETLAILREVRAADPHTAAVRLAFPDPNFPALLVNYQIGRMLCRKAVEAGVDLRTRPIGTGPFQAEEYKSRESYTLARNPNYWNGRATLDRIVLQFMSDASTRELALRGGELHGIELTARQDAVDRMRRARMGVDLTTPANMFTLHFNMKQRPLEDIRVRRALCHATNREELTAFLGRDVSKPEVSPLPSGYVGHTDQVPTYPFDPDRAKALLAEAGHGGGLAFNLPVSNNAIYLPPMQVIQEQWRRIGVNLTFRVVDHPTYHRLIREDVAPVVIYGAFRYPLTGNNYLRQFYHSSAAIGTPTAATNFSHFGEGGGGVDAELDAAVREVDGARQRALWQTAQRKILDAAVAMPLYTRAYALARSPKLDLGHEQKSSSFYTFTVASRILR
jgi:peptide/nickel transport system substrate-binding protein